MRFFTWKKTLFAQVRNPSAAARRTLEAEVRDRLEGSQWNLVPVATPSMSGISKPMNMMYGMLKTALLELGHEAALRSTRPNSLQEVDFSLELDEQTLREIRERAEYNSACTKESHLRTEADLDLLQRRTAHLEYCKPPRVCTRGRIR